jgi:hypothetical protein
MTRLQRFRDWVLSNWPIKLTALVLATVLWAVTAAQETTSQLVPVVLEVQVPEGRTLTSDLPDVQARFAGTLRELIRLYESPPTIRKTIPDTIVGNSFTLELSPGEIEVTESADVIAQELQPRSITVALDDVMERRVQVVPRVRITPDSGYGMFGNITVLPDFVTVQGPEVMVNAVESVSTVPIDTAGVQEPVSIRVSLDTTGFGVVRVSQFSVVVSADIGQVSEHMIMGVSVMIREGGWQSTPSAVIVTVTGPSARLLNLSRDSVRVYAQPSGTADQQTVPLTVEAPAGITARVRPDSAVVQRRTGG